MTFFSREVRSLCQTSFLCASIPSPVFNVNVQILNVTTKIRFIISSMIYWSFSLFFSCQDFAKTIYGICFNVSIVYDLSSLLMYKWVNGYLFTDYILYSELVSKWIFNVFHIFIW